MWKPKMGENHIMIFLYQDYIHLIYENQIKMRLQLPSFTSTNWKEVTTP